MAKREAQISREIKVEFCNRVIPSVIMRYLNCLTKQDIVSINNTEILKIKRFGQITLLTPEMFRNNNFVNKDGQNIVETEIRCYDKCHVGLFRPIEFLHKYNKYYRVEY
jgi:hypothetical protein